MLWFLIGLATLLSLLSLRGEAARARYYRQRLGAKPGSFPRATVIVPVKGFDENLRENLAALAALDYPSYELIVTCRSAGDLPGNVVPPPARLVQAGEPPPETSEKIGNLLAAIRASDPNTEVLAFADSDGRVRRDWLSALVAALETDGAGASTGYRWHLPQHADLPSMLRSVWNAVIAGGFGEQSASFCWGGAMAIRRRTFEELRIAEWWKGTISDDYRLAQALRTGGLRIVFAPGALVAAEDHTTWAELLSWTARQMRITRFYAPGLWRLALFAHVVYCGSMAAGLWLGLQGSPVAWGCIGVQLGIGYWKAWRRLSLASLAMPEQAGWFRRNRVTHALLTPVGTWLWLIACLKAGLRNSIQWRGYTYRLRTPPPL